MKIRTAFILALGVTLTSAVPAMADWEPTRWGMSPDEALAVLDGARAHEPASNEIYEEAGKSYAPRVVFGHEVEGVAGRVSLLFDAANSLRFVLFNPSDLADCERLSAELKARHGEGEGLKNSVMSITDWTADGDAIKLTHSAAAKICNLSYSRAG